LIYFVFYAIGKRYNYLSQYWRRKMRKIVFLTGQVALGWLLGTQLVMAQACNLTKTCPGGQLCIKQVCSDVDYMSFDYTKKMNKKAEQFLTVLKTQQLNVVTAESLTSGMIISTLVNIPLYGAYTYGGFSTYDSDAKRKMIGVKAGNVYTETTARQMAEGALRNTRAMVAIAVTGHAGPVDKDHLEDLGVVDMAVSIRGRAQIGEAQNAVFNTAHRRITLCDGDGLHRTQKVCNQYRAEAKADPNGYVSDQILSLTRKLIRQNVVIEALKLARQHLEASPACEKERDTSSCSLLESMCNEPYDGRYSDYGEPSWVIDKHSVVCKTEN
jgi:PncC family amidohydrolase